MDAQDFRSLQEAYLEVVENQQLDEGKKRFPSGRVNSQATKHERDYLNNPSSSSGASSIGKSTKMRAISSIVSAGDDPRKTIHKQDLRKLGKPEFGEQVDIYDIILSHLLDEGYANSYESALVILETMSEGWFDEILSEATFHGKMPGRAIQTRATPSGNYTPSKNEPDQRDSAMKSTLDQMKASAQADNKADDDYWAGVKANRDKNNILKQQKTPSRGITHGEPVLRRQGPNGKRRTGTPPRTIAGRRLEDLRRRLRSDPITVVFDHQDDPGTDISTPQAKKNNQRYWRIQRALSNRHNWGQKREEIEYLLNLMVIEGYANSYESALVILETMSEGWFDDLIEKFNPEDYKEYHQKDHRDDRLDDNDEDQWDREYKEYQRERAQKDRQRDVGRRKRAIAATIKERQRRARR